VVLVVDVGGRQRAAVEVGAAAWSVERAGRIG
jgi:hypothetical protein